MQIVLNHVTRMKVPRICVAGIEPSSHAHVRPVTPRSDPITRDLLRAKGGPFGPGALVDIGEVVAAGQPPEVEDHRSATKHAQHIEDLTNEEYLTLLDRVARGNVAFESDLYEVRPGKFAVPAGAGVGSLAVTAPDAAQLRIEFGSLFLHLEIAGAKAKLRVTDARFYDLEDFALRADLVLDVNRRLESGVDAYAMLGLARAMNDGEAGMVHWLQCNGLCLADRAVADVP
jgi:hypothetical protein